MEAYAKRIPQGYFGELDLVAFLKEWAGHLSDALHYGYNYYFLNQPISKIVLGALEKNKVQDTLSVIEILSQAKRLSVIQQEKIDVLRLVKKIKEKRLAINSRAFKEEVKRHLKKYAFMGMFYFKGQPWQADEVVQRVKAWIKDNNWQTELKKMNQLKKIDLKMNKKN